MSEFFSDSKRLKAMIEEAFEKAGIRPYYEATDEGAYYPSRQDIESQRRAEMLLKNPLLLKCLTFAEIDVIRRTGVVPADLEQRLTKQLQQDAEAENPDTTTTTEVIVNQKRVKFFQLFPEIEQQLSLEEIEKFRRTGDLPSKVFDKFGTKIIQYLVNSFPSQ